MNDTNKTMQSLGSHNSPPSSTTTAAAASRSSPPPPLPVTKSSTAKATTKSRRPSPDAAAADWILDQYDATITKKPDDIEVEIRRLQALKSFDLLDARTTDAALERLTRLAARTCRKPWALLSLVDLGRVYFLAVHHHQHQQSSLGANNNSSNHIANENGTTVTTTSTDDDSSPLPWRELPRKACFCAHTILLKPAHDVFVVDHASTDVRFADSPWVQELGVERYAGVPLQTPEGYRIGSLSVMDTKKQSTSTADDDDGSHNNQDNHETDHPWHAALQDLAAAVMDILLEKRVAWQAAHSRTLAVGNNHAHQWMMPYDVQRAAVQLRDSLHHLQQDVDFCTVASDVHRSLLHSACTTADHLVSSVVVSNSNNGKNGAASALNGQISVSTGHHHSQQQHTRRSSEGGTKDMDYQTETDQGQDGDSVADAANRTDNPQMPPLPPPPARRTSSGSGSNNNNNNEVSQQVSPSQQQNTIVHISKLVQNLVAAMEVFPKKVHLAFVVDPAVPTEIVCPSDLKVFRSALALLTSACERTEQGFVRFHIYKKQPTETQTTTTAQQMLVFECEDTGRDVALEQYHELFQTPKHEREQQQAAQEDEECITVDPVTGTMLPKRVCQGIKKPPVSGGFAVYPVARYVQSLGGEYGYLPRVARTSSTTDNVPDTGSVFWFSIPLRQAASSLDAAIGAALGLDDDDERQVVGGGASSSATMRLAAQPRQQPFY